MQIDEESAHSFWANGSNSNARENSPHPGLPTLIGDEKRF
jgi:hypothetical protein